jgi:pimeloyl-ACP methyl ester carboxylesterase
VHVIGFSDGAIIGLLLASQHPSRVRSLVSISANLHPDCFVADDEAGPDARPDADRERADYLALSPDGPGHVDEVLAKLGTMWTTQPQIQPASLAAITAPTLVLAADRDVIALDHTLEIVRNIPDARLAVLPGSHLLVGEHPTLVADVVQVFIASGD